MDEVEKLLREIVAAQQDIYDRWASLPNSAESPADLDQKRIDLLNAKLELARYLERKEV